MSATVIDLRNAEDRRDLVHRTVQALAEGRLVGLPTETVYGLAANAMDERAVERLLAVKGRKAGHALTLAIKSAAEAADYVPDLSPLAQRLARRCWPGPVTLVVDDAHPDSLIQRLPPKSRQAVAPTKTIGLRVPAHDFTQEVLQMLAGPLALSSANHSGQPDAVNAAEIVAALGGEVDLVLDDGPCRFGQPSSVVQVTGNRFRVLRAGVVPERTLRRLASLIVVLVCTGNTCRSPMAEAIARRLVADRLGCEPPQIEDHGVIVASAGLAAMDGGGATPEAIVAMSERGLDISQHETQPLSETLVRQADYLFTMTRSHREAIVAQWPEAAERAQMLSAAGADVGDPVGGPLERYRRCAEQIEDELRGRVAELPL